MEKQELNVIYTEFGVQVILKDELFTKRGKLKKKVRGGVAALVKLEAHKFIDAHSPEEIIEHSTIQREEVEVEN